MKQPKNSTRAPSPLRAQTGATAGRDKVREEAHRANVPRQSQRPSERKSKGRKGTL